MCNSFKWSGKVLNASKRHARSLFSLELRKVPARQLTVTTAWCGSPGLLGLLGNEQGVGWGLTHSINMERTRHDHLETPECVFPFAFLSMIENILMLGKIEGKRRRG